MKNVSLVVVGLLLSGVAVSGCLGPERATEYHVYGSKGSYVSGFAYDGKGVVPFDGAAFLDVNDETNMGTFVARGHVMGRDYEVVFEEFVQSKPFHDGGIAAEFREHGASGVGDMSIPEVDLEMAGWGYATFKVGGGVVKDPATGADTWAAHFMVIRNGVRDNTTGAIWADANKSAPYDPAEPQNGTSLVGDYELHLVLKNQTANASADPIGIPPISGNTPSAMFSATPSLFTSTVLGATAYVFINVTGTGVSASNLTFTFRDPGGNTLVSRAVGPMTASPAMGPSSAQVSFPVSFLGEYPVQITGRIAPGGGYQLSGLVIPPPTTALNFWWEDLLFGLEAEERAEADGLLEGTAAHTDDHSTNTTAARA